jgi:hypothetical protein
MDAAEEILQKVREILQKMQSGVDAFIDAVNATLSRIPDFLDWIFDEVKKFWDKLVAKLKEFWDWFVDKLSYVGNPFMLGGAAGTWREVGGQVSNQQREVDDSDVTVDDNWSGRGADQYKQSLPPQRDAMKSIDTDFANNIAGGLTQLAVAIGIFWGLVVTAILTCVVGVSVATGAAVSILGLPAAPPAVYIAVTAAIVQLTTGTIQLVAQAAMVNDTMAKTRSGVQTWPAFVTS